jgi:prepilin-type N-terminal cleavage/methylation domain-containing protein
MDSGRQDTNADSPRRSLPAFTLIELMVVVGIILILVAIAVPAVRALTKSNSQKQAVNLLTSMVARARALAIQSHEMAGVYIFESDSSTTANGVIASKSGGQSYAQIVVGAQDTGIASGQSFLQGAVSLVTDVGGDVNGVPVPPGTTGNAQPLPKDVIVAALDDDPNSLVRMSTETVAGNERLRLIVFDENGQLVLRRNMQVFVSGTTAPSAVYNNSSPGFLVFSLADLQAAIDAGAIPALPAGVWNQTQAQQTARDKALGNWIEQNADVLIFNTYTGNVIR